MPNKHLIFSTCFYFIGRTESHFESIPKHSRKKILTWALELKYKCWDIFFSRFLRNDVKDLDKGNDYALLVEMEVIIAHVGNSIEAP